MTHSLNKSEILQSAAKFLHDKNLYPAVAHSAYYSCYQLMKHIWLYSLGKSEDELSSRITASRMGSHELLINEISSHIKKSGNKDNNVHFRDFNQKIGQLKKLRINADYENSLFDFSMSSTSISLSNDIVPILKKY